ncbi:MAG TPA: ComEC/Rec2 family competence protein [Spirochaetia bacterium]|nr:ComEC/Rec2 family competence protein [Spirochaetia bacterium]
MSIPVAVRVSYPTALAIAAAAGYYLPAVVATDLPVINLSIRAVGIVIAALACVGTLGRPSRTMLFIVAAGLWLGSAANSAVTDAGRSASTGVPIQQVVSFEGTAVADSRTLSDGRTVVPLRLESMHGHDGRWVTARGRLLLFVRGSDPSPQFRWGELVHVRAHVTAAEHGSAFAGSADYLCYAPGKQVTSSGISSTILCFRSTVLSGIFGASEQMGPSAGPLFRALFTGNQDALDPDTVMLFRRAGCAHILALSGMHLSILTGAIGFLLARLLGRKIGYAGGLLCVAAYLLIAGDRASLLRAAFMYAFSGFVAARCRRVDGISILALCFSLQLMCNPESGMTVSFQLSYLALFGILLFAPPVVDALSPYLTRGVASLLAVGIGAQLSVTPLITALFGCFYPGGTIAGVILGVLVTIFLWSGLLFICLTPVGGILAHLCSEAARAVAQVSVGVAEMAARAPEVRLPTAAVIALCACGVALVHVRTIRRIFGYSTSAEGATTE